MSDLPAPLRTPHPDRLAPTSPGYDAIVAAHETALDDGAAGYLDPLTGYFVFTAGYLWDRGHCCEQGCRHCPYLDQDARLGA